MTSNAGGRAARKGSTARKQTRAKGGGKPSAAKNPEDRAEEPVETYLCSELRDRNAGQEARSQGGRQVELDQRADCKGRSCELWGKTQEEQASLGAKQEARSNPQQ